MGRLRDGELLLLCQLVLPSSNHPAEETTEWPRQPHQRNRLR
jgi:hypothetical protein